jgi:peptide/nickel transport system permease protein
MAESDTSAGYETLDAVLKGDSTSSSARSFRLRQSGLARLIFKRLLIGLALCVLLSILVFVGTQVLPGDAASAILGRNATPDAVANLREKLNLDRPATAQYFDWLRGVLTGDFGESAAARRPVSELVSGNVLNTATLAGLALLILIPISVLLGVLAAIRPNGVLDYVISGGTLAMIAVPEFVIGTLLVAAIAVNLGLLPAVSIVPPGSNPLQFPIVLVLPALTLVFAGVAYTVRMVRAGVIDVMESEYIESARLNGIPERRIIMRYVLPNALAPTVQTIALTAQWLIGGAIVVETVFQYPGLGLALVQAVSVRDIPTVQAIAILVGFTYILVNVAADIITIMLVPKVRTAL